MADKIHGNVWRLCAGLAFAGMVAATACTIEEPSRSKNTTVQDFAFMEKAWNAQTYQSQQNMCEGWRENPDLALALIYKSGLDNDTQNIPPMDTVRAFFDFKCLG